jgi:hypothetical protein
VRGLGLVLAVVRELRERRAPVGPEELAEFETAAVLSPGGRVVRSTHHRHARRGTVNFTLIMIYFAKASTGCRRFDEA